VEAFLDTSASASGSGAASATGSGTGGGGGVCTAEEAEDRLERVTVASLTALASLLPALDEAALGRVATPEALAAAAGAGQVYSGGGGGAGAKALSEVFTEGVIWPRFLQDPRPPVRRAAYGLLSATCSQLGPLLRQTGQVGKVAQHACALLGAEREAGNAPAMWEAVLLVLHTFPKALAAGQLDCKAHLFPRVLKLLRAGCYGAAPAACHSLLPLVSLVPPAASGDGPSPGCFYTDALDALWKGARTEKSHSGAGSSCGEGPYLVAVVEVASYLLVRPEEGATPPSLGPALVWHLLAALARHVADASSAFGGGGRALGQALVAAVAQLERCGRNNRGASACCLLQPGLEAALWRGVRRVAERLLHLPLPPSSSSSDGEQQQDQQQEEEGLLAAVLEAGAARTAQDPKALGAAAAALSEVLAGALDKVAAAGGSLEGRQGEGQEEEKELGLERTMACLFWRCLAPTVQEDFAPFLALAEVVALRVPYPRLVSASCGDGDEGDDAATFLQLRVVPRIQALAATSHSPPAPSPAALRPLVGLATAVALGLGPGPHWEALVNAAAGGGLAVLLSALEAVAEARGRYGKAAAAAGGGLPSLPSLSELLSGALAPHALAALEGEEVGDVARQRARFLAFCLGTGGGRRRTATAHAPLLAPAAMAGLAERALALRSLVGVEAALAALDGEGEEEGSVASSALGGHAPELLAAAFELLGLGADARLASVLRRQGEEGRALFRAAVVASLAVRRLVLPPSFRLKTFC
jgi:hypothetical protein